MGETEKGFLEEMIPWSRIFKDKRDLTKNYKKGGSRKTQQIHRIGAQRYRRLWCVQISTHI